MIQRALQSDLKGILPSVQIFQYFISIKCYNIFYLSLLSVLGYRKHILDEHGLLRKYSNR